MRRLTEAAQVAQLIRKELKQAFPQIKFSVTSSTYSMGDSVRINYLNGVPTKEVEKITDKYQDGHFDGMIDLYEYAPNPENLPRAKYVFVNREISPEIKQEVKEHIANMYGLENINDEKEWHEKFGMWSDMKVWSYLQDKTYNR